MKKAGLYVRVSTQEQKLHGMSVDNQIEALINYCNEHGYQYTIYNDAGTSGSKSLAKRPALLHLLQDCADKKIQICLFTRLDRFCRSVSTYYKCIEKMDGVPWRAIWEDLETESAEGKFKTNIMLSLAQAEADKTSQRLKDSYQYRKAKGIYIGRPPVGYLIDQGRLVKDPATKDGVQATFNTYLTTLSTSKAMRKAEEYGLLFNRASFPKMLKNPTYAGKTHNGHICEPYITPDQQELIKTVKHSRKIKQKYPDRTYIFSGLCFCGYCGRRMVGKTHEQRKLKNGKIVTYGRYVCQGGLSTLNHCPKHLEISLNKLEQCMLSRIDVEIGHLKYQASIAKQDIADKVKAREKLNLRLERAKEMYIDGEISKDMYLGKKMQIEKELSMIQITNEKIPELPPQWQEIYHSLTPENKQMFWKKIINKIIITNETKDTPKIFFN